MALNLIPKMDPMEAFREIAQSAVTKARVLPFSHRERFGYEIDARLLVRNWDALEARAAKAEARVSELEAAVSALMHAITNPKPSEQRK